MLSLLSFIAIIIYFLKVIYCFHNNTKDNIALSIYKIYLSLLFNMGINIYNLNCFQIEMVIINY